jgi:hypothetical protein
VFVGSSDDTITITYAKDVLAKCLATPMPGSSGVVTRR